MFSADLICQHFALDVIEEPDTPVPPDPACISEERLEMALEAHEAGIFDYDLAAAKIYWSKQQRQIFGAPDTPATLAEVWRLIHADDRPGVRRCLRAALKRRDEHIACEFRFHHSSGEIRQALASAKIVYTGRGRLARLVGCTKDITRRRRVEAELRAERARLKASYDHAPICIVESDRDGVIIAANPGLTQILGWTPQETLGRKFYHLAAPGDDLDDKRLYRQLLAGDIDTYALDRKSRHKNGEHRWVHISCTAVRDEDDGAFLYAIRVLSDVTARKRDEEMLQLLNHELSHRVKNTLATVQSMVRQTMRHSDTPEEFEKKIEFRLQGLAATHDLLTRSGWDGAALGDLVRAELAPFHGEQSQRWRMQGPLVQLAANKAVNVGMILHELATNAVKYGAMSDHGGHVDVAWTVRDGEHGSAVMLEWSESGGPEVASPTRSGFGSRLLTMLARSLCGDLSLDFTASGLQARMSFPP